MKLLLLGSGGREHALAWKIAQSPKIDKLYIAPGNAGTANEGENVNLKADDFEGIKQFVLEKSIDMIVVGPEDPLVKGIYDVFKQDEQLKSIPVIGPSKQGAVLEGSKEFAKGFMQRHNVPTAAYQSFTGETLEEGLRFLETLQPPYVLKADGLCAGKGVLILPSLDEAKKELKEMLGGMFGNASATVVIEEFLSGIELRQRTTSALVSTIRVSTQAVWAVCRPFLLLTRNLCKRWKTASSVQPWKVWLRKASTTKVSSSSDSSEWIVTIHAQRQATQW